jgi:hypothetical protein
LVDTNWKSKYGNTFLMEFTDGNNVQSPLLFNGAAGNRGVGGAYGAPVLPVTTFTGYSQGK